MTIGERRHRLDIQEPMSIQDQTTGELTDTFATIGTVWASIQPVHGREATRSDNQILGEMDTRIRVRWSELTNRLTVKHRAVHQGTVFNFVSIAQIDLEQRIIEIMAKNGINDG